MKPASAKAKGRRLQQHVRDRIRETFELEEDDVRSTSMGAGGEDVLLSPRARAVFPFSVESANRERVNLWDKWAQACKNCGDHKPLLVISRNRSEVLAVLRFEDLLGLLKLLNFYSNGVALR